MKFIIPALLFTALTPITLLADVNPYVRPANPGEFPTPTTNLPYRTAFFPAFTDHPDTPDQSSIHLAISDPLAVVVPGFVSPGQGGQKKYVLSQVGNSLTLDYYFIMNGGITRTIYGPTDLVYAIDPLPAGDYQLTLRSFFSATAEDMLNPSGADINAFIANPAAYNAARGSTLQSSSRTSSFTIHATTSSVPEPASLSLLSLAIPLLLRKTRRS